MSKQLHLPYNFSKEQIDTTFKNKMDFINKSNISKLDKKILINEYYNMYKNSILILNKNNNIGMIYPISTKNKNYSYISKYCEELQHDKSKVVIEEIKENRKYKILPNGDKKLL